MIKQYALKEWVSGENEPRRLYVYGEFSNYHDANEARKFAIGMGNPLCFPVMVD